MPLNTSDLENRIQQKIDGLTTSNDSIEFVVTGISGFDNVKSSVANTASLPNIYTDGIPNGTVVFVESLGVPVIASQNKWLGLDGRLLQKDAEFGIWTSGLGSLGRLGDGTTVNKSSPVSVVGGFTDWCYISDTAAIRTNGTLWTWGIGNDGRLGSGFSSDRSSPVSVVGGFNDWCHVSSGSENHAAVRTNGTLWTWGGNFAGQLGDNTGVDKASPVSVAGNFTDWCHVSITQRYMAAIRQNGTIWTWGYNSGGELGDGTNVSKSSPVSLLGGFTDWCQVSAGRNHTLAMRQNGTLWAWGFNSGRLGDGTTVNKSSPVSVVGGFTDWCQISAGSYHSVALRTNGTLWAWGSCNDGRFGDNGGNTRSSPVSVVGGFTDWCQISAGSAHTAAVRTNGTLWTWGRNNCGQLGDGTTVNKSSPVSVVGGFTDWFQVSAGLDMNTALRACIL